MSSLRRAVVTGLGPITPIGIGAEDFWKNLCEGRSGIGHITRFDSGPCHAKSAAEILDFDPAIFFPPHRLKRLDRFTQFAVASARLALEDSGIVPGEVSAPHRCGVSFGTALAGICNAERQHEIFLERGVRGVGKALALLVFGGSAHSNIAIEFGFSGIGTTNSNSCASGNVALGDAYRFIREDLADIIIAGGAEAPLSPLTFAAFDNINTMSRTAWDPPRRACRPFDKRRDGFVMAEGAASLVVEEYEHARARGARIYGEIVGYSLNNEAYHMTSPDPTGEPLRRAIKDALRCARLNPAQIDYVNAHASSTPMNDINEIRCLESIFYSNGSRPAPLAVSGTKGATGHPLGATAAIEAVATLLAMRDGIRPPTLHLDDPEEAAGIDLVPNESREGAIDCALTNAFGFGGINSCIVFSGC